MSIGPPPALRELGQYEVIEKIAEGGMGAVYKARPVAGGAVVAIKVLPTETARNPTLLRRFEQEFRAAALIDHPNVVKAIEYCPGPPSPFLVMEYVDGCSLGDRIERHGPLPEAEAVHIISQVCEGLHGAHKQGLIHRDVKPDNVLLTRDLTAKLTDLGLVRDVESDENLTRTGRGLGTPYFMAPEQFRNAKYVDVRSDVYSLGATLYMAVTGQVPFGKCSPLDCWMRKTKDDFPAPQEVAPRVSDRVDFAIRRAMCANPADRPRSCREFMEDVLGGPWTPRHSAAASGLHAPLPDDLWYLVYYEGGAAKTVKGGTETIRKNVRAGTLGDLSAVLVSRSKAGPFAPLKNVPEFRDLVFTGTPAPSGLSSRGRIQPIRPPASGSRLPRSGPTDPTPPPQKASTPRPVPSTSEVRTDELPMVPVTTPSTAQLGTNERPLLSTRGRIPRWSAGRTDHLPPWVIAALVAAALGIGLAVGLLVR
jgi:serine/threonine protein kinase